MSSSTKKMVAFGELMLRLDPFACERFVQADTFKARYTGAEANVAVSLAGFGVESYVVSKVPDHEIGQSCINYLRRYGVNTDYIARGGDRLGILYVETGASQRPSKVVYDRAHSSITGIEPDDFDWNRILADKNWFHVSGTAPALGPAMCAAVETALKTARKLGVGTSFDCNYRSKLWGSKKAGKILGSLMEGVDVFIGGVEDASALFGITPSDKMAEDDRARAEYAARGIRERFGCMYVALGMRSGDSSSVNQYSGMVHGVGGCAFSRSYNIQMVDRIGSGDAFTAGIIYQIMQNADLQDMVEFAAAAACLKHSIPGDFNLVSNEEVMQLLGGGQAGRPQR